MAPSVMAEDQMGVRVGVIGLGSVSEKYVPHLRRLNLEGLPCEIVAVADTRPEQAIRAAEWGLPNFTTNPDEVIGRDDVDAVLILTAMQAHGALTRAALKAGKHVLVEKPMSMDLAEAAELVELAKVSPGHLVCAPHVTLSWTYQQMWRELQAGKIGRVVSARGLYGWAGPDWGAWFYEPGGGPMFDLGVYNVTTLTGLLGPARRVMAMSGTAIPERIVDNRKVKVQTEDNSQLLIDFGDQCFAVVTTGFTIQKYRCCGIELYGTDGTLQMLGEDWDPKGYELWENSKGCWQVHEQRGFWPWTDGLRDFIEAIHHGRAPVNKPEHAYHVLEIMVKSFESARMGQALPILSRFDPPRFDDHRPATAPHLDHAPN